MIGIKIESIFIISKKLKKNTGHPINSRIAQSGRGLARSGPKNPGFKRDNEMKDLTL